jgi:hypothetical protein
MADRLNELGAAGDVCRLEFSIAARVALLSFVSCYRYTNSSPEPSTGMDPSSGGPPAWPVHMQPLRRRHPSTRVRVCHAPPRLSHTALHPSQSPSAVPCRTAAGAQTVPQKARRSSPSSRRSIGHGNCCQSARASRAPPIRFTTVDYPTVSQLPARSCRCRETAVLSSNGMHRSPWFQTRPGDSRLQSRLLHALLHVSGQSMSYLSSHLANTRRKEPRGLWLWDVAGHTEPHSHC